MAEDRLFTLASRIQPALRSLPPAQRLNAYGEVVPLLFTAPFALPALVWLAWATDWPATLRQAPALLLLGIAGAAFRRFASRLSWEPGVDAGTGGEFESRFTFTVTAWPLLVWAAALAWGAGLLWLLVLWPLQHLKLAYRFAFALPAGRWSWRLSAVSQSLAFGVLPALLALTVYQAAGGVRPPDALTPSVMGPLLLACVFMGLAPALVAAPLLAYLLVFVNAGAARVTMWRLLLSSAGLLGLAHLFASLGAGLMVEGGLLALVLFAAGLWLITYLLFRLNAVGEQSQREIATLSQLERLAQALLGAPAEDSDLPAILGSALPAIFGPAWLEITLFPDDVLYHQGLDWPPVDADVWARLRGTRAPFLLLPMVARSPDGRAALNALVVPIGGTPAPDAASFSSDVEAPNPGPGRVIGGIYLVLHRHLGEASRWLPALQSIAGQISAARQREESHRRVLDYQARLYQQEVYAQSYKAEALAERLAYQQAASELRLAGEIQASLLPTYAPEVAGWEVAVALEPARDASGDFYDFIPLAGGRIGILMADVAGKGIGAALYMAVSKTLLRTYAQEYPAEPARVFAAANARMLTDTQGDWFVTAFYGVLDPERGTLTYSNAGHNPPLLWADAGEEPDSLWRTGIPLGLFDGQSWEQKTVSLEPGSMLVLYTDGVTEAQDDFNDMFGVERLCAVVGASLGRPAEIVEFNVFEAIEDFVGDAPQNDDIALMVIARERDG